MNEGRMKKSHDALSRFEVGPSSPTMSPVDAPLGTCYLHWSQISNSQLTHQPTTSGGTCKHQLAKPTRNSQISTLNWHTNSQNQLATGTPTPNLQISTCHWHTNLQNQLATRKINSQLAKYLDPATSHIGLAMES